MSRSCSQSQSQTDEEEDDYSPLKGRDARIEMMFNQFENQMDENLEQIADEHEGMEFLSDLRDLRRVKSDEHYQTLSYRQAKKLYRIVHQARKEVEVLKDNNEQFMSEIEQADEEHRSEIKLMEERTKQKLSEMRAMYQQEMDMLLREKDAAIVESGKTAVRYAESGRKQILTLKKQLSKLRTVANETIRKRVEG